MTNLLTQDNVTRVSVGIYVDQPNWPMSCFQELELLWEKDQYINIKLPYRIYVQFIRHQHDRITH